MSDSKEVPSVATKLVYGFGDGTAEGSAELKNLLGGKGAGLAEMSRLGIPVPPGFTLTTEACIHVQRNDGAWPPGLEAEVREQLTRLEKLRGERFGDLERPLLVSVRSGAVVSMPGMMDTVLDLGLTREIVEARCSADGGRESGFWLDCYRRLLMMFGSVVLGLPEGELVAAVAEARRSEDRDEEARPGPGGQRRAIAGLEAVYRRHDKELPQDPFAQLRASIDAVFASWSNRRAHEYRRLHGIPEDLGTGATVQTMVFGNRGAGCASGVAFTRNPATGEPLLYGEYLLDAQGEDVVAGTHTPRPIGAGAGSLAEEMPKAYDELCEIAKVLEQHFRNMQDVEFTVDRSRLYMLQTRTGKRSGPAAVRIAVEMVDEGLIDEREALRRVEPQHLVQMMAPVFDAAERERARKEGQLLARGLPAGPGAASGRIAFDAQRAADMAHEGGPVLLVRDETSPEDIVGMYASVGILTTRGGMTSHAAVVARGLGKPCVVGAGDLQVDEAAGVLHAGSRAIREGEWLSLDGTSGEVLEGRLTTQPSQVLAALRGKGEKTPASVAFERLLQWADRERRLRVRANADTPEDARTARALGAEGIGLCRTEHMFFEAERIPWVRQLILARDEKERQRALAKLLPVQQGDFEGILRALHGLPVTIRLLDPPLHEFLPREEEAIARLAADMDVPIEHVHAKVESLAESNPMLGHRGCRLGLTTPEIYDMQVEAIVRATCRLMREGIAAHPEIMIPLVGVEEEIARLRRRTADLVARIAQEEGVELAIPIGTMIEVPRAALIADKIARHADFFSFGTNDLTQMTYGFSRDDVARFLVRYVEDGILPFDPFARLDTEGVGQLVEMACRLGRQTRSDLKLGICGEHGGDPHSIEFFAAVGLDYVSCSPYRVPIARLAAARAALGAGAEMGDEALGK
jgi:pyruvate, orthophosphate dikinase